MEPIFELFRAEICIKMGSKWRFLIGRKYQKDSLLPGAKEAAPARIAPAGSGRTKNSGGDGRVAGSDDCVDRVDRVDDGRVALCTVATVEDVLK